MKYLVQDWSEGFDRCRILTEKQSSLEHILLWCALVSDTMLKVPYKILQLLLLFFWMYSLAGVQFVTPHHKEISTLFCMSYWNLRILTVHMFYLKNTWFPQKIQLLIMILRCLNEIWRLRFNRQQLPISVSLEHSLTRPSPPLSLSPSPGSFCSHWCCCRV